MKNKMFKLFVLMITFFSFLTNVNAASLNVSANSKTVVTGGSVSITINANGLIGKFSVTSSNGNVLSGGTNGVWLENNSKTYKFSAKSIGTATIKVVPIDVSDSSGNVFKASKSITINVVKPREKSTNNNLKDLSVDGYSISPSFDKNTLEYTVNLESNVEKIKINATKEDGYASVSGIGEKDVQEGDNKFEITVTSETGKSKVYTVNAVVKDSNPIVKEIDNCKYTVIKRNSTLVKPDSFIDKIVKINDFDIPAFYNEVTNITLIGLKDEAGKIYLFKYNTDDGSLAKYETFTSISKTIIFENTDEEIENYNKTTVTIDDKEYKAYQHKDNKDYILIYGMDLETGKKDWYTYHIKENTIQNYILGDIITGMEANFNKVLDEYKLILLFMAVLSLVLLLVIIIQIVLKSKTRKKYINKMQLQKDSYENKLKELTNKNSEDKVDLEKSDNKLKAKPKKKK